MYWNKPLPKPVRAVMEKIRGKTLYRSSVTNHYIDAVTKEDYGRHEIDWMLARGIVTQTINFNRFVYEFTLSPYYD